jgi:hypothetical protein
MKRGRALLIFAVFAAAASIAFVLRNAIYEIVIVPLAYIWWVIGLYYRFIPQTLVWVLLIFLVLFTAARALLISIPVRDRVMQKGDPVESPIRQLSILMQKQRQGMYYRWVLANRLGKLSRELLDQREGHVSAKRFTRLIGRDWKPPAGVEAYLESGLNGSFADYPQSRWGHVQPAPLDEDPRHVIEYLEAEMETGRNGHR